MAKPKNKAQQRPAPPPEEDDDDDLVPGITPPPADADQDQEAQAELADALAELGGISGATVTVNRVNDGREEFCDRYPASEFDLFSIRERFGAGTYWIYGRDGKRLYRKGRVIFAQTIEERRGRSALLPAAAATDPLASMREMYDRQAQRDREMMQMFLQAMTANRPAPTTEMQTVVDLASKLAHLGGKRESSDPLEQLLKYHKLMKEIGGEGGGGDSSALIELGKMFVERLPAPAPAASNGQPAAAGDQSQMMAMMIRRALAARLPMLIAGAQRATDPGVYAQLVLDQVPEIYVEPLLEQLRKPDWFDALVQVDGRVVPLQAWFEALRNEILQATSQDPLPAA